MTFKWKILDIEKTYRAEILAKCFGKGDSVYDFSAVYTFLFRIFLLSPDPTVLVWWFLVHV